jgi:hypothetical protein
VAICSDFRWRALLAAFLSGCLALLTYLASEEDAPILHGGLSHGNWAVLIHLAIQGLLVEALCAGAVILFPSLFALFRVFKGTRP